MKNKLIITAAGALAISALAAIPAFAQTASSTRAADRAAAVQQRTTKVEDRGTQEIDARVTSLNGLITRISQFKNVSDAQKSTIAATVQALITDLTALKGKIAADTSTTTMKTDVQSVTKDYRVYALVMPQLSIVAASDRVVTISAMLAQISAKLQTRLGMTNMNSLQANLTDLNAKITDAAAQAQAAVGAVSALMPDQGDKTVLASNTATLKDARSKIKTATTDLAAARKDVQTIIQALVKADKAMGSTTPVTASTTTTTTVTASTSATTGSTTTR